MLRNFRDQGSLTVDCLHFLFLCLLTRHQGQRGGGGGGCTHQVNEVLDVNVAVNVHPVLGPGKDDY